MAVAELLISVLLISATIWYLQYHFKRRRLYRMASQFSGPLSLPFLGNALYFAVSNTVLLKKMENTMKQYKSPMRMWFGQQLVVLVYTPRDAETILNSPHALEKERMVFKHYEFALGAGLGTAPVKIWKRNRKVIAPLFKQTNLKEFLPVFTKYSDILATQLKKEVNNGIFDVYYYLNRCTLDMVSETTMGVTVDAQTTDCNIEQWLIRALQVIYLRASRIWYHFDVIFKHSKLASEMNIVLKNIMEFVNRIITDARSDYIQQQVRNTEQPLVEIAEEKETRNSLIHHLIKLCDEGIYFSDKQLQDEVITFLAAGSETTASVIGFTLIMLGMFPEIQKRVYEEIIDTLGTDGQISHKDLNKLEYMERVLKETMRIFPLGVATIRSVTQDIELEAGTIPAGSTAAVVILGLHRDPQVWPNPLKFDPDRFLPEATSKRDPYSWIPFSSGPRNCVGIKYAWMSMKTMLSAILQKYKVSTCYKSIEEMEIKLTVTIKPAQGYLIKIEPRE